MSSSPIRHLTASLLGVTAVFCLCACGESDPVDATDELKQVTTSTPPQQGHPQSEAVKNVLLAEARKQAAGLGRGRVTVHGAWNYTGYSTLTPLPQARLVAVDLTIVDHTINFDYKDIEIVDGALGMSYGSDPYIAVLDSSGKLETDPESIAGAPGPTRLLLVYGFPKSSEIFDLVYWGQKLNIDPIKPTESGWEVPYPSTPAADSSSHPDLPSSPPPAPASKSE